MLLLLYFYQSHCLKICLHLYSLSILSESGIYSEIHSRCLNIWNKKQKRLMIKQKIKFKEISSDQYHGVIMISIYIISLSVALLVYEILHYNWFIIFKSIKMKVSSMTLSLKRVHFVPINRFYILRLLVEPFYRMPY